MRGATPVGYGATTPRWRATCAWTPPAPRARPELELCPPSHLIKAANIARSLECQAAPVRAPSGTPESIGSQSEPRPLERYIRAGFAGLRSFKSGSHPEVEGDPASRVEKRPRRRPRRRGHCSRCGLRDDSQTFEGTAAGRGRYSPPRIAICVQVRRFTRLTNAFPSLRSLREERTSRMEPMEEVRSMSW